MKIALDARPLNNKKTGIGNYVHHLLDELLKIDKVNEYFLFSNEEIYFDNSKYPNSNKFVFKDKIGSLWLGFKVPFLLKKYDIDLFWGTQHMTPLFKPKGIEYLLTIHDLALYKYPYVATKYINIVNRIFIPRSIAISDKILCDSYSTKNDVINRFKKSKDKHISIIYPAANKIFTKNDKEFSRKYISEKYKIDDKFILFVGTLEPRKNITTLIKAFDNIVKEKNLKLVIVGGKGWKFESVFQLIDNLKLNSKIIFPGYVTDEDLVYFYNSCEIFVLPSLYEGFGIPLLEARNCGAKVLASNNSSLPEIVGDKRYLFDNVEDSLELQTKILEVLEEDNTEGYDNLHEKFDWAISAQKFYDLINNKMREKSW